MKISFLGVGNMGAPLAENMLAAGEALAIYTRRRDCADRFAGHGARVVANIPDLGDCDVLCTCLPMPEDVVNAVTGTDGLYEHMRPGSIHLEFSTIAPETARMLATAAKEKGIGYVQATVSKTPQVAREGKAPFFVGGDARSVAVVMPLLARIGQPTDLKTTDAACGMKLLSNLMVMSNVAIIAEGMRLGQLAGIEAHELVRLLLNTGAASFQLQARGPMIADDDYEARFAVDLAAKDLRLGCAMAKELGYEPKMIAQAHDYMHQAHDEGLGSEDICALYKIMRPA